jgi:hypothetical protein
VAVTIGSILESDRIWLDAPRLEADSFVCAPRGDRRFAEPFVVPTLTANPCGTLICIGVRGVLAPHVARQR